MRIGFFNVQRSEKLSPVASTTTSRRHGTPSTGGPAQTNAQNRADVECAGSGPGVRNVPASRLGEGRTAESTHPVRSLRDWFAFQYRWHRYYKPALSRPIPITPANASEIRRRLFHLQRVIK